MKFGSQLQASLYPDWEEYYLDYNGLKKHLKQAGKSEKGHTEKYESEFVERLDKELEKIYAFQNDKIKEIKDRIQQCENAVASITRDPSLNVPDRYAEIESEINSITEDLNQLATYARLNYTGIIKIVKKHDRHTKYMLRPMFNVRLNARPFYKETYEPIIVQLSKLYHTVHVALGYEQKPNIPSSPGNFSSSWRSLATVSTQHFLRRNYKFWVHPDNLMEVKITILRHLPVLVYKAASDPSVNTVYLENHDFKLYQNKIDHKDGEQIIRLRWYGSKEPTNEIFVERKVHDQEAGEVKDRFMIKKKYVAAFLKNEYSMEKTVKKMKEASGKKDLEVKQFEKLVSEIQTTIKGENLQPVLRTNYNRIAFQVPGDSRIRVSLDTDFVSIREDDFDGTNRSKQGEWHRTDIEDEQSSLNKLPTSDYVKFPYAVLEVKLMLEENEEEPKWVQELIESHLVEPTPHFSKYVHGVATMFTSQAPSLPFWLPDVDKDIRKQPSASQPTTPTTSSVHIPSNERRRSSASKHIGYVEVVVDNNKKKDKGKGVDRRPRSQDEGDDEGSNERTPLLNKNRDSDQSPYISGFTATFENLFRRRGKPPSGTVTLPSAVHVPKKPEVPIRVEPKVYFANERTFFSWMRFSLLLGSLSLALFNAGTVDNVGKTSGLIYSAISVTTLFYALFQYLKRDRMINSRDPGPYDDLVFPTILGVALFLAVALNFWLKLAPKIVEDRDGNGTNDTLVV